MKKGAPKAGFRYDGLYKVVAQEQLINGKGGAYLRFKLKRLPVQPLVDKSRPNADDLRKVRTIKEAVQEKCK
jgi:translation elongation factor P/translation initiation factor 5A